MRVPVDGVRVLLHDQRGARARLGTVSAREWGRRQAEAAPLWTDHQWQEACALLRIHATEVRHLGRHEDQDMPVMPERRAA
jgi:hypothetical protein